MQFALQFGLGEQFLQVAGDMNPALIQFQQGNMFFALAGTQDDPQRLGLVRLALIAFEPTQGASACSSFPSGTFQRKNRVSAGRHNLCQ